MVWSQGGVLDIKMIDTNDLRMKLFLEMIFRFI